MRETKSTQLNSPLFNKSWSKYWNLWQKVNNDIWTFGIKVSQCREWIGNPKWKFDKYLITTRCVQMSGLLWCLYMHSCYLVWLVHDWYRRNWRPWQVHFCRTSLIWHWVPVKKKHSHPDFSSQKCQHIFLGVQILSFLIHHKSTMAYIIYYHNFKTDIVFEAQIKLRVEMITSWKSSGPSWKCRKW